ncbi:MAG: esterase-like activity of phytase family protein [Alphaproteobacteria bacterium]
MYRPIGRRFTTALLLVGMALSLHGAAQAAPGSAPERVAVRTVAVPLSVYDGNKSTKVGKLKFLSGIELKADHVDFGGISGLVINKSGRRFLAITDKGRYIKGVFDESAPGVITQVKGVKIARLSGLQGLLDNKKKQDAESIIDLSDGALTGPFLIAFERKHRVLRYGRINGDPDSALALPGADTWVPSNGGMEGIVQLADGRIMALTEDARDEAGNIVGWIADGPQALPLSLQKIGQFKPTDMARLPNGDVLVLERSFSKATGPGMQIRRIRAANITHRAILDGPVLARLNRSANIDNMEALDVRVTADGRTLLYIMSDDNFNTPLQRTLLLVFELLN